jgi:hypothetical protein
MNQREREILNGVRGMLDNALTLLPPGDPADEQHARGWITTALREVGKMLVTEAEAYAMADDAGMSRADLAAAIARGSAAVLDDGSAAGETWQEWLTRRFPDRRMGRWFSEANARSQGWPSSAAGETDAP